MPGMIIKDSLKDAFLSVDKNTPLIVTTSLILLLIIVGFYLILISFAGLMVLQAGIDFTYPIDFYERLLSDKEMQRNLLRTSITAFAFFLIYILFVSLLLQFIMAASCGMIARGLESRNYRFRLKELFSEGRRLFIPVQVFAFFITISMLMGLVFLSVYYFTAEKSVDLLTALYPATGSISYAFTGLLTITILFFLITGILSISFYGLGILSFKNTTVLKSIDEAVSFIVKRPSAFWFSAFLAGGYSVFSFLTLFCIALFMEIISFGPYFEALISQVMLTTAQSAYGFLLTASMFSYYRRCHRSVPEFSDRIT